MRRFGAEVRRSFFVHLPLRVVRPLHDHLTDLFVRELHIGVFPLHVSLSPVEQFLVVVTFEVRTAKTVECALHAFSFLRSPAGWLTTLLYL